MAATGNCLLHALQFHGFGQRLSETIGVDAVANAGHVCPHIACGYGPQSFIYLTVILHQHRDASAQTCIDCLITLGIEMQDLSITLCILESECCLLACTNCVMCSAIGGSLLLPGHQVLCPRCGRQRRQRMAKSQACQMDCHQQLDCQKLCVASPDLWGCDLVHAAECAKLNQGSRTRCATSYQACSRPHLKL